MPEVRDRSVSAPGPEAGRTSVVDHAGRARFGCYDGPVDLRLDAFRLRSFYGREVGAFRRRMARGAFTFLGIQTGDLLVGLASVRLGYASHAFGYVFDAATGQLVETSARALPGACTFFPEPDAGEIRFAARGLRLRLARSHTDGRLEVEADCGRLAVQGRFNLGFAQHPLRVVNPSCGDPRRFTFTEKAAPLAAESLSVRLDGVERAQPGALAVSDWSAGYFARHTHWLWAAFAGHLADGTPAGANFAALVNESCYPENAFWIGGVRERLPRVLFDVDPDGPAAAPWRVFTEDGRVDLRFRPLGHRGERSWLPGVKVNFRQHLGLYSGRLGDAVLPDTLGFAECHSSVW